MDRDEQIVREYLGKIEALRQREATVRQLAWKVVLSKGEPEEMERLIIETIFITSPPILFPGEKSSTSPFPPAPLLIKQPSMQVVVL